MKQSTKIILGVTAGAVVVGGGGYVYWRLRAKGQGGGGGSDPAGGTTSHRTGGTSGLGETLGRLTSLVGNAASSYHAQAEGGGRDGGGSGMTDVGGSRQGGSSGYGDGGGSPTLEGPSSGTSSRQY